MFSQKQIKKLKTEAYKYFGDDGYYDKNIKLSSVISVSYNLEKITPNIFLASNSISLGIFYNFFTLEEVRAFKKELIGNDDMCIEFSKTHKNSTYAISFAKKAKKFFSMYDKNQLKYSISNNGGKVNIMLDMSSDELPSNLVWAINSSLHRFKD